MSLLEEIISILKDLKFDVQTSIYENIAPSKYCVLTPITDTFSVYADNLPQVDIEEVRISFFSKFNYLEDKERIEKSLLSLDITITDRRYQGYETDTGYHHYVIDVAKHKYLGGK